MTMRYLTKKTSNYIVRYFSTTNNQKPNPNKQDFGPIIITCLLYLGYNLTKKYNKYQKNIK